MRPPAAVNDHSIIRLVVGSRCGGKHAPGRFQPTLTYGHICSSRGQTSRVRRRLTARRGDVKGIRSPHIRRFWPSARRGESSAVFKPSRAVRSTQLAVITKRKREAEVPRSAVERSHSTGWRSAWSPSPSRSREVAVRRRRTRRRDVNGNADRPKAKCWSMSLVAAGSGQCPATVKARGHQDDGASGTERANALSPGAGVADLQYGRRTPPAARIIGGRRGAAGSVSTDASAKRNFRRPFTPQQKPGSVRAHLPV